MHFHDRFSGFFITAYYPTFIFSCQVFCQRVRQRKIGIFENDTVNISVYHLFLSNIFLLFPNFTP